MTRYAHLSEAKIISTISNWITFALSSKHLESFKVHAIISRFAHTYSEHSLLNSRFARNFLTKVIWFSFYWKSTVAKISLRSILLRKLHKILFRFAHLDICFSVLASLEISNQIFNLQDSHLSELNGAGHHSQYTPNSSSSSTTNSGGTAENPVDLSNSRPPPTNPAAGTAAHDQRNGGALLHDSSKI